MKDWMLANGFMLLIVLVGSGLFFLLFWLVRWCGFNDEYERYAMLMAALVDLFVTFYITKHVHRFIDRQLFKRAQRAH